MDDETSGLVSSVVINLVVFLVFILLFTFYRKYRSRNIGAELPGERPKVPPLSESDAELGDLLSRVFKMPLEELDNYCGSEAKVMLLLHKSLFWLTLILCGLAFAVLVPAYASGEGQADSDIGVISFNHIGKDSALLVCPLIMSLVFSGLGYYMAFWFLKKSLQISGEAKKNVSQYTLCIDGVPRNFDSQSLSEQVTQTMQKYGEVLRCYVPKDMCEVYCLEKEIEACEERLEHFKNYQTYKGKRDKVATKMMCCKKVDAIEFYEHKLPELTQKRDALLEKSELPNAGVAFVIFKYPTDVAFALKNFKGQRDELNSFLWELSPADTPQNIIWKNLNVNQRKMKSVRICLSVSFIVLFAFLVTPTAFLNYAEAVLEELGIADLVVGLLGQYLPTILLIVYQSVFLPLVISYVVDTEKHLSESVVTIRAMELFLAFNVIHMLLVPAIGMQAIEIVSKAAEGDTEGFAEFMMTRLTNSGIFFTVLVIGFAFLSNGSLLLAIGRIVSVKLKQSNAVTDKEKILAYEAELFPFPLQYSIGLTGYIIALTFSVIFPLILPFAVVFFGIRYFVLKYDFLCLYFTPQVGSNSAPLIFKSMILGVLMFQIVTGVIFTLTSITFYVVYGFLFLVASVVLYLVSRNLLNRIIHKHLSTSLMENFLEQENLYGFPTSQPEILVEKE